ncbi:hypothetical protein DL96DRAFT_1021653 [Flagelloscypha sp. PMI_526]|nr:hypothetical protein DL96DRAFT_1021653 [Flagelloscypha sp. PMI_526]
MRAVIVAVTALSLASGVSASPAPRATGKRGATWTWFNTNLNPSLLGANGQVKYMYNYETYQPATGKGNLEFIGMQGCYPSCDSSPVNDLANRASQQGWTKVFSANEPDLQGKSPGELANWYRQYIEPLAIQKAYPAVTSSTDSGKGLDWLAQFISACSGCYHDWINLHWYGSNFAQFQSHIQNAHSRFPNERIIVTEYALVAPASADQQNAFFKQAVAFLDGP